MTRAGVAYHTVAGTNDRRPARVEEDRRRWVAGVVRGPCRPRIGVLGHNYPGMLTCPRISPWSIRRSAPTSRCWRSTTSARGSPRARRRGRGEGRGDPGDVRVRGPVRRPIAGPIEDEALDWSARVAVGLDALVDDFELDALTYYYRGVGGNEAERLGAGLIVGNSLLTARGIPTAARPTSRPTSRS